MRVDITDEAQSALAAWVCGETLKGGRTGCSRAVSIKPSMAPRRWQRGDKGGCSMNGSPRLVGSVRGRTQVTETDEGSADRPKKRRTLALFGSCSGAPSQIAWCGIGVLR